MAAAQAVTHLVVDADGALRAIGEYERGMDRAARATDAATGATANFEKRMAVVNAQMEKGLSVTTQSVDRIDREARAYQNLAASVDPVYKLRMRLEREAAKAAVDATNAVIGGYETQEGALRTLMALEQRHAAQLATAAGASTKAVTATNNLTNATQKLAAANDNARLNTANLAAQFQDVAVTAAMGMSPMQIALQQGTQIAGALGDQGAAGSVKALGAALLALVSPTAIVTIGLTAAAAAAIQYFMSSEDDTKRTNELLKQHGEIIAGLRASYGEAASGLDEYTRKSQAVLKAEAMIAGDKLKAELKNVTDTLIDSGDILAKAKAELQQREYEMLAGVDANKLAEVLPAFDANRKAMEAAGDAALVATKKFAPFSTAIDAFAESARKGAPDYIALREAVAQAINADPTNKTLRDLGAQILNVTEKGAEVQAAMRQGAAGIALLGDQAAASTNNVISFAAALANLGRQVPEMARMQQVQAGTTKNLDTLRQGLADLDRQMRDGSIRSEDAYLKKRQELEESFRRAQVEVTGLGAATRELERVERQAQIGGMGDREAEATRIRDRYEELNKTLRESGAGPEAFTRATAAMNAELAVSTKHFDELDAKAGEKGAAKGLREAEKAARELERSIDSLRDRADGLVEKFFPGEAARREAMELQGLLDQFGGSLDDIQRKAVEMRIGDQFEAARLGVRELDKDLHGANDELKAMGEIGQDALGGLLDILYQSGNLAENLLSLFAGIGKQFAQIGLEKLWKSLGGQQGGGINLNVSAASGSATQQSRMVAAETGKAIGAAAAPVLSDGLSSSLNSWAAAIRKVESGSFEGNYNAMGPVTKSGDRGYGAYQVMGNNIASWTKEVLGQSLSIKQFLADRGAQDKVFLAKFGQSADKFGSMADATSVWFSGRPLAKAGSASDGYNTVPQYLSKVQANEATFRNSIRKGTADGLIDGSRQLTKSVSAETSTRATTAADAGSVNLQNAFSVGGAALGAFAGGYQSGSPIMGGISGALTGAGSISALSALGLGAAAGPVGIIGGAILGIVGGLFGKSKQRKQEQKQAQQQLNQNKAALEELFARGEGRGLGATTQSYNDFYDKTAQLDEIAQKAGDDELVKKLRDNVNKFFIILEKDYVGKFKGLAEAYSSGLGSNSPFVQGAAEMEQLREEVKNFVADARSFGELQLKNNRDLTPEQLEARVAEAERAAQKMVLANISGVRELGQVEAGLLRLDGVAVAAKTSLEQLGMEAEEAAKAVQGQLNVAIAKLKDNLLRDLTSSLNDLSGVGFLNDIMDAQVLYQQRLDDASRLGIDGSLALRELSLSIGDIVKQAGLGKNELAMLAQSFPQLQFILNGVSTSSMTLADATSELQAAYDKEASALDDLIAASKNGIAAIKQFRDAMKINDSSPLSPADKVAEAAKQFRDLADKAAGGDTEALGQLTQIGQDYLDEARSYYASSAGYLDIWNEVDSTLARVKTATEGQLTKAEEQKRALDASVSGILDINTSVKSVAEALAQYNATQATGFQNLATQLGLMAKIGSSSIDAAYQANIGRAPEGAGKAYWQNQLNSGKTVDQVVDAIANSREAQIVGVYREIMKRDIDSASRSYWMQSGKSIDQIRADLTYAKTQGAMRLGGVVGAYATGGVVGNGIYDVDSVRARYAGGGDILLAGGEFVTRAGSNNGATRPTLDYINRTGNLPGNDNSALIAAINRLTAENAEIKTAMRMLAAATAEGSEKQAKASARMASAVGEMTDELKRENSR